MQDGDSPARQRPLHPRSHARAKKTAQAGRGAHRDNGERILIYEHSKTGEVFIVPEPELHLDQIEKVQAEVSSLLMPQLKIRASSPCVTNLPGTPLPGLSYQVANPSIATIRDFGDSQPCRQAEIPEEATNFFD